MSCPGCGAFAQWAEPEEPGFYNLNRGVVKKFVNRALASTRQAGPDNQIIGETREATPVTDAAGAVASPSEAGEAAQADTKQEIVSERATDESIGTPAAEAIQAEPKQETISGQAMEESTTVPAEKSASSSEAKSSQTKRPAAQGQQQLPWAPTKAFLT